MMLHEDFCKMCGCSPIYVKGKVTPEKDYFLCPERERFESDFRMASSRTIKDSYSNGERWFKVTGIEKYCKHYKLALEIIAVEKL